MCGITALFAFREEAANIDRNELDAICARMIPRGPDAGGTWISDDGRVGMGSRRLAILDLSADGEQPMRSGDLTIVFNGEIYNHAELRAALQRRGIRFHSTSDTEVILELYRLDGPSTFERLRGMFSIVIWDRRSRRLVVARDPYGIKPLYYCTHGGVFRAASTVKALLAGGQIPTARDAAAAAGFFVFGSIPEPFTTHEAIRAMEPGTFFIVDDDGIGPCHQFFSIPAILQRASGQSWESRLVHPPVLMRELIAESVRHHLVSDVPVGVFLSSGIDSTVLATLAAGMTGERLRTITLAFDEYRGLPEDESLLAERFAADIGACHTTRRLSREEFLADLPRVLDAMDQPTIDGMNTWFVSKAAAEQGLKVALSGLGGDELLGSYPSFADLPRMVAMGRTPLAYEIVKRVSRHPKANALARYGSTWAGAYLLKRGLHLPEELESIVGKETAEEGLARLQLATSIERIALEPDPGTSFGRVASLEATLYMRNQLLRDTDWASMAHSVEVRTPLVDAFLLRQLAPLVVAKGSASKQIFAASPTRPLPSWLARRRKTGFSFPLAKWMNLAPDGTSRRMRSWASYIFDSFAA